LRQPSILRELLDSVLAVAFPAACLLCGRELTSEGLSRICRDCWAGLEPWTGPACASCGLPFASPHAQDSATLQCGECRKSLAAFDKARSFAIYTGNLRRVILHVKFGRQERLGKRLGELLAGLWDSLPELRERDSPVIVPVPLHPSRQRERGFNQAELLAAGLVRALRKGGAELRVRKGCLRRRRATPPQTGLSLAARRENLRGAFEAGVPEQIRGRTVVLIDDVMTTGATLSACARALKRAGAERVFGLTLARATPQFPDFASAAADIPLDGLDRDST
jgi:ComF family protein